MFERKMRLAALATSATAVLLLAGCSGGEPVDTPPPASDYHAEADHTGAPDLMGAAPAPDASQAQDGLLGGPAGYQSGGHVAERPLPPPGQHNAHLKTWRRPDGTLVTAMRPIANPKGSSRTEQPRRAYAQKPQAQPHRVYATIPAKPAPVAPKPVIANAKPITPKTVAPAPAPIQAAKPVQPAAPLAKPPVVAAVPVVPAKPAKPATKLEQLQAAVAPEATNGAVLAAGESLSKNQPGQVTLSLPATLGDRIKEEAAKLGLGKAAKKTSAYANLEGQGYEITPNGRQTAVVKPGEPTTFAWQVKPGPEAKGQIRSQFGVELNGTKQPQGFALGEISKRVFTLPEKAKKSFGDFKLEGLNGKISLPGLGDVSTKTVLGVALVLLALIILVGVSRSAAASRRRAERQRKYRTLTDYGRNEMEFEDPKPASANVSYVNPFVAAAGGAAVGAVAASAFSNHDDHHGHTEHAHDGHGHDAHGHHDDHGHQAHADHDHGHAAHDDHGHAAEAHPEPHAPAEHVSYVNPMVAATTAPAADAHAHAPHAHDAHGPEHAAHDHDDHGDHDHPPQAHAAHDDHGHHAKQPEPVH